MEGKEKELLTLTLGVAIARLTKQEMEEEEEEDEHDDDDDVGEEEVEEQVGDQMEEQEESEVGSETEFYDMDDLDWDEIDECEKRVHEARVACNVCCETLTITDVPITLDGCKHVFCRSCIVGLVRFGPHNPRCPYSECGVPITPLDEAAVFGTRDFVGREKSRRAFAENGMVCPSSDCVGVFPVIASELPSRSHCDTCGADYCGRRACGTPWMAGHRCPDIIEQERLREERRQAMQREEERQREAQRQAMQRELGLQGGDRWQRGQLEQQEMWDPSNILGRIREAPKFQLCPDCGTMTELESGCNIVSHFPGCGAEWCWACGGRGTCGHYHCRGDASQRVAAPQLEQVAAPRPEHVAAAEEHRQQSEQAVAPQPEQQGGQDWQVNDACLDCGGRGTCRPGVCQDAMRTALAAGRQPEHQRSARAVARQLERRRQEDDRRLACLWYLCPVL